MAASPSAAPERFCHSCQAHTGVRLISPFLPSSRSCERCGSTFADGEAEAEAQVMGEAADDSHLQSLRLFSRLIHSWEQQQQQQQQQQQEHHQQLQDPLSADAALEELIERLLTSGGDQPDRPVSADFLKSLPEVVLKPAHFCRLKLSLEGGPVDAEPIYPTEARFGTSLVQSHCDRFLQAAAATTDSPDSEIAPQMQFMEHFRGSLVAASPIQGCSDPADVISPESWAQKMVLMDRGRITFADKARLVQGLGGRVLLVCQTLPSWPFVMTDSGASKYQLQQPPLQQQQQQQDSIAIPSIMIGPADSERLKASLIPPPPPGGEVVLSSEFHSLSCCVCQCDLEIGEEVTRLPCGHYYHLEECLKSWLAKRSSCPLCRLELPVDEAVAAARPPSTRGPNDMASAFSTTSMWG